MLSNNRSTALTYDKKPYLICKSDDPSEEIYYVKNASLPALDLPDCDPMSLISKKELYAMKKAHRGVSNKIIQKVVECYKKNKTEFDFGPDQKLEDSLFVSAVEDLILQKLKTQYRNESANFYPFYDKSALGQRCFNTQVVGASGAGKSWITSFIIRMNFAKSPIIIFSPTADKDPAWVELRKTLGRRVKLINSNSVDVEIQLKDLPGGSVLVVDDICATCEPAKHIISALQSRCLYESRHHTNKEGIGCIVFGIYHDAWAMGSKGLRASNVECSRIILFPNLNRGITTKFLSKRLHWNAKEIKKLYAFIKENDRYVCIFRHIPNLVMCAHGVLLL